MLEMAQVDFDVEHHIYRLRTNGVRIRSVTDALSVVTNFDHVPPDVLETARRFGSQVHKTVHYFLMSDLDERSLHPLLKARLDQFKQFLVDSKFEVLHTERIVIDPAHRYCGTLDLTGLMPRRKSKVSALIDLKSGAVPKTVGLQTAGYQYACEERPRKRFALQLKEDSYRLIALEDERDYSWFISCLNVYKLSLKDNPYSEMVDAAR